MKRYKKYVWNTGYLLNKEKITTLDPQPIAERLEFLRQENGGSIRPDDVLEDAKNAESPLAVLFTNSIENDAYEYRLQIASTVCVWKLSTRKPKRWTPSTHSST